MAWIKSKTLWAVLAILLMAGVAAVLIYEHAHQYKGRSHFPKSSWASAGFGDPVSALETGCWATVQGDGKTMLASLAPELQKPLQKAWETKAKAQGISLEDFLASHAKESFGYVLGFRVLGVRTVNDHQAFVHIYIQGFWHKATVHMKKIGNDWKVAGISWK